jgi:hypothetical protein
MIKGKGTPRDTEIVVPEVEEMLETHGPRRVQMRWRDTVPGETFTWEQLIAYCYNERRMKVADIATVLSKRAGIEVSMSAVNKKIQDLRSRGLM